MNRRKFLGQSALFTTGIITMPKLMFAKTNQKYGLQLFSLREQLPKDVKGVIAKVAAAGYKQVETFGYSKENGFWGLSAVEFKKLLRSNGLTTPSGHYGMDAFFKSGEINTIDNVIEAAKILEQDYVVIPYISPNLRQNANDIKSLVNWVNVAAKRVQNSGLKLSYHNHNFEFEPVDGLMIMDVLLKNTDPDLVDFEMDVYWVIRAGNDPVQWLENYPGRFKLIHVKDMDKADPKLNTEAGSGSIDFKKIFKAAKSEGVKYYIVEQENFKMDPYASIAQSNKYLRDIL
ncbi:sugar phosphate isomerase/epimerase family protein [Mucilaginibacter sp. OK098]|uniref:sugar phosphate isomerase/epimerase family protein n=1 Tax=Mucilaginibacter sp. OK098 TaxID=1855297 RepID=UPI000912C099|nr:sugar phosphate isomerase/epimerase [Mucilaginibacter sp. OK098]SHM98505.1 Sugar phosphate isomerase/epimerase [Mucilaginibacter sp. OK098]